MLLLFNYSLRSFQFISTHIHLKFTEFTNLYYQIFVRTKTNIEYLNEPNLTIIIIT